MKKILLLITLVFFSYMTKAQTVVFQDNFNDEDISDWTLYDEDGDGIPWGAVQVTDDMGNPEGTPVLRSSSWNGDPLTPDNYVVSPAIDLSNASGNITLEWVVTAADENFADENYTVYVTDAGNAVSDVNSASISFNELVTDNGPGGLDNPYTKTLDISSLAGSSSVYVAFRHHNVTDQFTIEIDDVTVTADNLSTDEFSRVNFEFFVNNDQLNLSANQSFDNINIFDLSGKQVMSQTLSSNDENVSIQNFANGLYLAKVKIGEQTKTFKFVK
ncbi:MAG: choice-of-anchor J domain-containing protein [Psychroflexus sp.]|nr:choice-of-anchor J domain-containing protein [Psychroflexus sp.]